jgi:hypothetical protein
VRCRLLRSGDGLAGEAEDISHLLLWPLRRHRLRPHGTAKVKIQRTASSCSYPSSSPVAGRVLALLLRRRFQECWLCYSDAASKDAGACPSPRWCSCSTLMKIHFVSGRYLFMCMSRCTELQTMQPLRPSSGNSLRAFVLLIHATSKILVQSHQHSYYFLLIAVCLLRLCLMIQKYP